MANSNHRNSTAISIEDRNVEGESGNEGGAAKKGRSKWPAILFLPKWETVFAVSCALAVFLDPVYPYIPVMKEGDDMCYYWDESLMWEFFVLRSALDLFYAMDIVIFWCQRNGNNAKAFGASSEKRETTVKGTILKLLPFLPRAYVALPFPQVIIIAGRYSSFNSFFLLMFFIPAQYILRVYRTYGLLKRCPDMETGIGRWLKAILDFLPFVLAAHLFGALWYNLSLQRELDCWTLACRDKRVGCDISGTGYYFYCGTAVDIATNLNTTHIIASCPLNPPDPTIFDFGIFLYGIQSNMTRSTDLPPKLFQCFWWGLRNLSSIGSNLPTSIYMVEICFTVLVSISGIVLFLIYLNTRVQMSQQRSGQLKLIRKKQMMDPYIDLWLSRNDLSNSNLRMVIMKNVHQKLEENKEVDMENILSLLPIIHQRFIMCLLSWNLLKRVPMLENMNIHVLKEICEHLKLVKYSEDNYIVREGEPLDKMLFITQGTAWSYPTSATGSSAIKCLVKGDFYGEELLNWASKLNSFSEFPTSTRNVKAHTKVEAFAIKANSLNIVVSKFWWHFSKRLDHIEDSQLERWQSLAASSIQANWRRRMQGRAMGVPVKKNISLKSILCCINVKNTNDLMP
ncbi:PREDICTED: cyclic nucleotide-gated ion channel 1-like [Prunus mume]|uniref:Cyclic nucleotide-gated ion channel 1-like n=1 Tax=Prunus mume TaxID=102107 RepID=A0ABM0PNZ2_PRUMU|nr:PREDICTED: cyclic nucleotide-gated ion channel 1-like [Prunus mume]XP_016651911.1 PREDICTED: cyclic nucleotide-gated ion channel 1-like [Prunus mume]XP_016651912.1 PREDICTED: cyclic nucleotide-gated ion channel 1-like [Prunus mume]